MFKQFRWNFTSGKWPFVLNVFQSDTWCKASLLQMFFIYMQIDIFILMCFFFSWLFWQRGLGQIGDDFFSDLNLREQIGETEVQDEFCQWM